MRWAYPLGFIAMGVEGALTGPAPPPILAAGLVVFGAAKALKAWAIASLGARWTFRVLVPPGAPLVTRGPYRVLRHPNYVALCGEFIGVALIVWAPIAGVVDAGRLRLAPAAAHRRRGSRVGAPVIAPCAGPRAGALARAACPAWVRIADVIVAVLTLASLSALITGGFRTEIVGLHVSLTTWWRPALAALLVGLARHAVARGAPSILARARAGLAAWRHDAVTRAIWPIVIISRIGVLVVGLMAVHAIGYPGGPHPVSRRRTGKPATCRHASTPGGTSRLRPTATSTCPTASTASRTWSSSRRSRS